MMLKLLLKKQIAEVFRSYFYDAKKNKARSKTATILWFVFFAVIMAGVLGGMFAALSYALCGSLVSLGMDWLYFLILDLLAIFLGVFGSVFNTYSGLYLAKDNDLLLSMPIPIKHIITARLMGVYLMGLMYSAVVVVPAIIVYWLTVPLNVAIIIGGLLLIPIISLLVLVLSCLLGWVVAKVSLKLKNKSFASVLLSLVGIGLYYFFYFKAQKIIENITEYAVEIGDRVMGSAYILYLFGRIGTGSRNAMLAFTAAIFIISALTMYLLARSFIHIATATGAAEKTVYREKTAKKRSVFGAVLSKEFGRFTSSANYMLNCGLGVLLIPAAGILLIIKGQDLYAHFEMTFGEKAASLPVLAAAAVCMLISMNDMAAPSVSLEGKNLWIARSLPIRSWDILRAKLSVQLILTESPTLIFVICAAIVFPASPPEKILCALLPLLFVLLSALFGLALNLKMPNLSWTNEVVPVKQSAPVAILLFSGWGYAIIVGGLYLWQGWHIGTAAFMSIAAVVTLGASAILYSWLKKQGVKRWENL